MVEPSAPAADAQRRAPRRETRGFNLRRPTLKEALIVSGACAAVCVLILVFVLRGLPGTGGPREVEAPPPVATADRVPPSPRGVYRVTGRVQLDQLPAEFFLAPVSGLVAEDLLEKRDLVLDGAVLLIGDGADNGRQRQLVANIVRLENGARIVTNGARLEVIANQLVSDNGSVVAFAFVEAARRATPRAAPRPEPVPERPRRRGEPEPVAEPLRPSTAATVLGTHGASGGTLRLVTLSPLRGRLSVRLNGQDGAAGEPGQPGYAASGGGSGDAIGDLIDCSRGVTGAGAGGAGGAGGDGGSGGVLELAGAAAGSRELVAFQTEPGFPGRGGPGGPGGAGGYISGDVCGVGSVPSGPTGAPGLAGQPGQPGRVLLIPEVE